MKILSKLIWTGGRLRFRFTLYAALLLVAFAAVVQAINWRSQEYIVRDRLSAHVSYVADVTARLIADRISHVNVDLGSILLPIVELENSIAIIVASPTGEILTASYGDAVPHYFRVASDAVVGTSPWGQGDEDRNHLSAQAAIDPGGMAGVVHVARVLSRPGEPSGSSLLDNAEFGAEASSLQQVLTRNTSFGLAIFALTLPLAWLLMTRATRGISAVTEAAQEVAEGNLDVQLPSSSHGEIGELQESFRRMTARLKANIRQIEDLAYTDAATGLPNRACFEGRYDAAFRRNELASGAVFLIDLDNFKAVNDTYGHRFGDVVLRCVAQRFREAICDTCREEPIADVMIARFGGDEFVVFVGFAEHYAGLGEVADVVVGALDTVDHVDGRRVHLSCSVGVTTFSKERVDVQRHLQRADLAMYEAKRAGRRRACFFSDGIMAAAERRVEIENGLRKALHNDLLTVFYQPKVSCETLGIIGAEALVRWRDPSMGPINPAEFIPVAEETGLIVDIGRFVLERSLADFHKLDRLGLPLSVAVNVSAQELAGSDYPATVTRALERHGFPANRLEVELTESEPIVSSDVGQDQIRRLKERGVRVAIDDFGTGYSSLSRLPSFKFDTLKIDKSFVSNLSDDSDNQAIVKLLLSLAGTLDLDVVAEGVEREQDFVLLRSMGAGIAQGYLWSPPLPFDEFLQFVRAHAGLPALPTASGGISDTA